MRKRVLLSGVALVAFVGLGETALPEAAHDRGGVSFDFERLSAERHPERYPNVGRNVLENPWKGVYTNGEDRVIALPHARGGKFRIAAMTKVRPMDVEVEMGNTAFMIRIGNLNKKGRFVETPRRGEYVWNGFVKRGRTWHVATKAFDVRPGETHALVMFKCDRARIEVKDVVLCEEVPQPASSAKPAESAPLTIKTEFCNYIDGAFEVSEGQVGELAFSFAKKGTFKAERGAFALTLPAGIDFVDATFARPGSAKTERRPDGSSVTTFLPETRFSPGEGAYWWSAKHILVRATRGIGPCGEGWLSYRLSGGATQVSAESMKIRFRIGPKIVGAQPKEYGCGGWQLSAYDFANPASAAALARFHQACGQNWIIPSASESYPHLALWRDCGFKCVTPQSGVWCRNGYELVMRGTQAPEDLRMVPVEEPAGRHAKGYQVALCPLAITGDSDYVRNECLKRVADNVKGVDGLWANWEPFMYKGKGCGCRRCGRAFAKFLGQDWTAISNDWPACAFTGAYARQGVEFRSRCHADVVRRLDEVVRSVTGKDSIGFMPGIHFGQMTSSWRTHHPMPEASPEHYAADIPWINLWGPYVPWRTGHRYFKERARHVAQFVCARDIREQVAGDYPAERRPRILAAPQGTSGDYFTQPEAFEMNYDAYFFNRFAGCCPWVFPMGADARYWRAFANASRRAAKYEDAVFKGVPADDRVKLETVPEFAAPVERIMRYVEKWRKVPQVFTASYDFGDVRYVAVFNCWQLGEAFFTLKVLGLPAGDYRIVSADGVLWTPDRSATWSAENLAKGVFLSVGCCRTRVFEIVPAGKASLTVPTSVMTAKRLCGYYAERRPILKKAAERDAWEAEDDVSGVTRCD